MSDPLIYNPNNHYYIVGGSSTEVFSTASFSYVTLPDSTYTDWVAEGGVATNVDDDDSLQLAIGSVVPLGGGVRYPKTDSPCSGRIYRFSAGVLEWRPVEHATSSNAAVFPWDSGDGVVTVAPLVLASGNGGSPQSDLEKLTLELESDSGSTNYHAADKNFDCFLTAYNGIPYFGTGPAWSSDTSRGVGAGTTAITQHTAGFYVNANEIELRWGTDSVADDHLITIPAGKATYAGTVRTTALASVDLNFGTANTTGQGAVIGIWNAFNRRPSACEVTDTTATWTYGTNTTRASRNITDNRISFIRGLDEDPVSAMFQQQINTATTAGNFASIAIGLDSTSAITSAGARGIAYTNANAANIVTPRADYRGFPGDGWHYIQALETGHSGTSTFVGGEGVYSFNALLWY